MIYFMFFKPALNALSFIHKVTMFDEHSDAFWCSMSPSSGSTTLIVNFSKTSTGFKHLPKHVVLKCGLHMRYTISKALSGSP